MKETQSTLKEKERIEQFVLEHQVCWQVQPVSAIHRDERIQVGFELELSATHTDSEETLEPGSPESQHLFGRLEELAKEVVSGLAESCRPKIEPFDHSIRFEPSRGSAPEVVLKLQILHRGDYFQSIDKAENECLKKTEKALKELGVQKGWWLPRRNLKRSQ